MKKRLTRILASMLAMLMVLSLAACGGDNKGGSSNPGGAGAPSDSSTPAPAGYKDTLTWIRVSKIWQVTATAGVSLPWWGSRLVTSPPWHQVRVSL